MDIDEVKSDGLKREYKITVPADELDKRINTILLDFRDRVRMKGFRPGKAPITLLKKLHGEAALGQAVEDSVRESTDQLFKEKNVRPAMQPKVDVGEVAQDKGFDFTVETEILPQIDISDFKAPAVERMTATPTDADVEASLEKLAEQSKTFTPAAKTYKAKSGDQVTVDFVGKIGGEPFEGGTGEDVQLELGSGQFIPGFEDQLIGVKTGGEKTISITFPEDYGAKDLAGKEASFDVTVKEVKTPEEAKVDENLAANFGLESLDALKDAMRTQLESEAQQLARAKVKRNLLDKLAEVYDFPVPEGMVDVEYRQIWEQIKRDAVMTGELNREDVEGLDEPEDKEDRKEYRSIAERRVRLGLLLSEIGMANNVEVSRDELMRKVAEQARRYPGQEQQVFEFYQQNQNALAQLRAPLYEEKVVDFILEMAEVDDKEVPLEALRKSVEEDAAEDEKAAEKTKAKKKAAPKKKAVSKSKAGGSEAGKADGAKKNSKASQEAGEEADAGAEEAGA